MKQKSSYILMAFAIFVIFFVYASAQSTPTTASEQIDEALPEAGLTPASPIHFLELFGDWVRLHVFTFNPARKAEVKIKLAEKRAAELKAVVEAGESGSVIERSEHLLKERTEQIERDIEILDNEGRSIDSLIEKFNDLSLRQQAVLEGVLDSAPEQAKDAIERALENSRKGLEKAEEVLNKQVDKKLAREEKAKEIFENTVLRLKKQAENRSKHLEDIIERFGEIPPDVIERFERQLKYLEDRLVNVESREELKEIRMELKDEVRDTASDILEFRRRHKLIGETGDDFLLDIERDRFEAPEKTESDSLDSSIRQDVKTEVKERNEVDTDEVESTKSTIRSDVKTFAEVRITNRGFEPNNIKIRRGQTVMWTNESGSSSWPASAVHPTHTVYPQKGGCIGSAFDACRRVGDGETYEFRFDHAGTWRYHDHIRPSFTGTIVVVE